MIKIIGTLLFASSLFQANDVEVNTLQWSSDLETLINLSSGVDNTIKGLDQNDNGIRDDVEYFVKNKYKNNDFQKETFLKAAKTMQTIITLPKNTKTSVRQQLDHDLINLYTCRDYILYKIESDEIDKEMEAKTLFKAKVLNTKARLRAYINHKKLLPSKFDELSDNQLEKEKNVCINSYKRYEQ